MKDLLDLCQLNLMEENVADSPAPDRDETLKTIDWKKRNLATKIAANTEPATPEAMERHRENNKLMYESESEN